MCIENIDARKHNSKMQYELRKQVIQMRKQGHKNTTVAESVGISASHVSTIWQRYKKEGSAAIKIRQRGRQHGDQQALRPAQKSSIKMISSITNQGQIRFMMYRGTMKCQLLNKFMTRLIRDAGRKVFLVLDNLRSHHGKVVQEWLSAHKEAIEVFYMPSYSPELNPDEYLNGGSKIRVHSGMPARNQKDLELKPKSFMQVIAKNINMFEITSNISR